MHEVEETTTEEAPATPAEPTPAPDVTPPGGEEPTPAPDVTPPAPGVGETPDGGDLPESS